MFRFRILTVGKKSPPWLEEGISPYIRRMRGSASVEFLWVRDDIELLQLVEKEKFKIVLLDERGEAMTSARFAGFVEELGSSVTFVIGGAEGLPLELKGRYPSFSLSRLTFPHLFVRLLLVEQLYRSLQILQGTPYHKD